MSTSTPGCSLPSRHDGASPVPVEGQRQVPLAALHPREHDPVVDLVRGGALLVVVLGHWVMQGLYVGGDGDLHRDGLLGLATWTHPLTWVLQVMPVIFAVG